MTHTPEAPERASQPSQHESDPTTPRRGRGRPKKPENAPPLPPNARALMVATLYNSGVATSEIQRILGHPGKPVSRQYVHQLLDRAGRTLKPRPTPEEIDAALDAAVASGIEERGEILHTAQQALRDRGQRVGIARVRERAIVRWGFRQLVPPEGVPAHYQRCCTCKQWFEPRSMVDRLCRLDHNERMRVYLELRRREAGTPTKAESAIQRKARGAAWRAIVLAYVEANGIDAAMAEYGRTRPAIHAILFTARREQTQGGS